MCKWIHYLLVTARKLWDDPLLAARKARHVLGLAGPESSLETDDPVRHHLGLQSGNIVRVKPMAKIRATLDSHGKCEGLGYMSVVMDLYCGGTYTVLKRVDRFFDERTQRMLKLNNVVILDRVYCEPEPHAEEGFAGCKRMCFLFWKEAWLKRMGPDELPGG